MAAPDDYDIFSALVAMFFCGFVGVLAIAALLIVDGLGTMEGLIMADSDNPWIVYWAVFVLAFGVAAFVYWFENR